MFSSFADTVTTLSPKSVGGSSGGRKKTTTTKNKIIPITTRQAILQNCSVTYKSKRKCRARQLRSFHNDIITNDPQFELFHDVLQQTMIRCTTNAAVKALLYDAIETFQTTTTTNQSSEGDVIDSLSSAAGATTTRKLYASSDIRRCSISKTDTSSTASLSYNGSIDCCTNATSQLPKNTDTVSSCDDPNRIMITTTSTEEQQKRISEQRLRRSLLLLQEAIQLCDDDNDLSSSSSSSSLDLTEKSMTTKSFPLPASPIGATVA